MTTDEIVMLTKARDKLKVDLAWRGPRGREQKLVVLDRELATAVLTVIERELERCEDP